MEWRDNGIIIGSRRHGRDQPDPRSDDAPARSSPRAGERRSQQAHAARCCSRAMPSRSRGAPVSRSISASTPSRRRSCAPPRLWRRPPACTASTCSRPAAPAGRARAARIALRGGHPRRRPARQSDVAPALLVPLRGDAAGRGRLWIDMEECAATGATQDLIYVSPNSGRAVCRTAGEPYKDKLLALPRFLRARHGRRRLPLDEVRDGFALTGFLSGAQLLHAARAAAARGPRRYLAGLGR